MDCSWLSCAQWVPHWDKRWIYTGRWWSMERNSIEVNSLVLSLSVLISLWTYRIVLPTYSSTHYAGAVEQSAAEGHAYTCTHLYPRVTVQLNCPCSDIPENQPSDGCNSITYDPLQLPDHMANLICTKCIHGYIQLGAVWPWWGMQQYTHPPYASAYTCLHILHLVSHCHPNTVLPHCYKRTRILAIYYYTTLFMGRCIVVAYENNWKSSS